MMRHKSRGLRPHIHEYWWKIFGYEVHLRMVPFEFTADVKCISNLIDDRKYDEAKLAIEDAYTRWGFDPDLIRADTLREFLINEE